MAKNIVTRELIEKFLMKECSAEEARRVILWLKDPNNKEEIEVLMSQKWEYSSDIKELDSDLNDIYIKVLHEITQEKNKIHRRLHVNVYLGIAATITLLIVSFFILVFYNDSNSDKDLVSNNNPLIIKATQGGEKLTTKLPDGTTVALNASSEIAFHENFNGDRREIKLKGEAYFEVAKDIHRPFIVKTGPIETQAVGTAFNIKAGLDSDITVSLTEGKVIVNSDTERDKRKQLHVLSPGEKITYDAKGQYLQKGNFDYLNTIAWKDGILVFKDADIDEIKQKIESWYGVKVIYKNLPSGHWKFNSIYKNENLENVLDGLKFSKNINYVIGNDIVEITFIN